jgi:hypothetical protein
MKKEIECKIVQNLLPNYIDELTDTEINQFIEDHIEGCAECEQVLKDMQGDIQLEKINSSKKINALKKVKNRYRRIAIISILCVILIGIIGLYFWNNYRFVTDDNGKVSIQRFTFDSRNISNYKNVIIRYKQEQKSGTLDGYVYTIIVLTVNEKNICINTREMEYGFDEEELTRLYNELKNAEVVAKILSNVEIVNDNAIIYNNNTQNGKDKDLIIQNFKKCFNDLLIEEY